MLSPVQPQQQVRPAPQPQAVAPAPGGVGAVPPARADSRAQNRTPQSTFVGTMPPPTNVQPAAPNVTRPVTRPQPVTPVPQQAIAVPGPAPAPVPAPVTRQAPVAPSAPINAAPGMLQPGAPMGAPPAAPAAPVAPAPSGGGLVRQR
jgi:hypothetical protein